MNSKANVRNFEPYDSGRQGWTRRDATHLLWRAQFGASAEEIQAAEQAGLEATLQRLLTPQAESAEFEASEPLLRQIATDTGNIENLKAWWLYRMLHSANPLVEKMSLFWHNHFATSNAKVQSVRHMTAQNDLIRREAVGSFRQLLTGMASNEAMLIWLDGNANRKRQANENFAREVMELFSLGVGNYTEQDIAEAARAFTGWHVRSGKFWFNRQQHDFDTKTLLGRSGNLDGGDVIEICLDQPACPRFLATKLLRTFVLPEPSTESVDQLAERIRKHDFQMQPVLRDLFGSQLFFSSEVRRSLIKCPLELVLGAARAVSNRPNLPELAKVSASLGQDVFEPPTVKGWEGGRLWINSATMLQRANFAAELLFGERLGTIHDHPLPANSTDSHQQTVRGFVELLQAHDLTPGTMDQLTDYWQQNRADPSRQTRGLIHLIMTMPEFQLT